MGTGTPHDRPHDGPEVDRDHDHDHDHGHDHEHAAGAWGWLVSVFRPHSHDSADSVDSALESSERGIRALKVSLVALLATAVLQGVVVAFSGSVALLADAVHNLADAGTAVPLWLAFWLGRRPANRRYTYGYGRAEDLAGLFVVLMIAASAVVAGWEAVRRLIAPAPVHNLGWVAAAGVIGFVGNELVATYRIRVGRDIGSAALVADGIHARTDGLTSLAVVAGAGGVALGYPMADPIVGLAIMVAILFVLRSAARDVFARLMDAVDPALVDAAERALAATAGVRSVSRVRMRWIGHRLHADADLVVDGFASAVDAHHVAHRAEADLVAAVPKLTAAVVHAYPGTATDVLDTTKSSARTTAPHAAGGHTDDHGH
jgi:cation diffusion facilitator family transporter